MGDEDEPKSGLNVGKVIAALTRLETGQSDMHGDIRDIKTEQRETNGRLSTLEREDTKRQGAAEERAKWEDKAAVAVDNRIDSGNRKIGWTIAGAGILVAGVTGVVQVFA